MLLVSALSETFDRSIGLFPNPVTDRLYVETEKPGSLATVVNAQGRIVQQQVLSGLTSELDTSALPSGMYILKLISRTGTGSRKFIKK